MGLLTTLTNAGSVLSQFDGTTPPNTAPTSTSPTHDQYSINGTPNIPGLPNPSSLDLDGVTPPKYLDNPPQ